MSKNCRLYLSHDYEDEDFPYKAPTQEQYNTRQNEILNMSYVMIEFMSRLSKEAQNQVKVTVHPTEINFVWEHKKGLGKGIYVEVGAVCNRELNGISVDFRSGKKEFLESFRDFDIFKGIPDNLTRIIELACTENEKDS